MIMKRIKQAIPCLMGILAVIFFLLMSDESRTPVTIDAVDMNRLSGYEDGAAIGLTPDSQYSGTMLASSGYLLDPGEYTIGIAYHTDGEDNELTVYDNGAELDAWTLDPEVTYKEYDFELERSSLDFRIEILSDGTSYVVIQSVTLIPKDRFYTDNTFLIVLFLLLTAGSR